MNTPPPSSLLRFGPGRLATLLVMALVGVAWVAVAQQHPGNVDSAEPTLTTAGEAALPTTTPGTAYSFSMLDSHPDALHHDHFAGAFSDTDWSPQDGRRLATAQDEFRWMLTMFQTAYGLDDNYTIRVFDDRTGETLETYRLSHLVTPDDSPSQAHWDTVDRARRTATRSLLDKWENQGTPREHLVVRWGRLDQVRQARQRDLPYLQYEVALAEQLGLSLLSTEIGTVETFNQDWMVSTAGARSRYQMMPDILRMFGLERFEVRAVNGRRVVVREERHPLLAMEPALMLLRAYANAVGHELPGISAYHTGPGNIFTLYREYVQSASDLSHGEHVSDAYMWGVTDGFEQVYDVSTFGPHSRAYVLRAYGSLRATEAESVSPSATYRVEQVRLKPDVHLSLADLLEMLRPHNRRLDWGAGNDDANLYVRFRELNPHLELPPARGSGVPENGNLRLAATSGGEALRFFLPYGASAVMARVGLDGVEALRTFTPESFSLADSERLPADHDYAELVESIGQFGFTAANASRLEALHDRMQALARRHPKSRFRQNQARIIRIHRSIWRTSAFDNLADAVQRTFTETSSAAEPIAKPVGQWPSLRPIGPSFPLLPITPMTN